MEQALLDKFTEIVGGGNALVGDGPLLDRYLKESRGIYVGRTPLVLRPGSTQEVAEIVILASANSVPIVPQGGNTGNVAGSVPDESGTQIVLSLERMRRIREIDLAGNCMTVDAGAILQEVREAAEQNGRLFPMSLASQGSCQIGGNISTNSGGISVLAYGNMRDLVLGLEVVLPSGEIWDGLRKLKKDNAGYSLKDLFIGAEGTLGIITGAVLKLWPLPASREISWVALQSPQAALELLAAAQSAAGRMLTAFELIHRTPLEFTLHHMHGSRDPFNERHEWYVLLEISSGRQDAREMMESILEQALETGLIQDAILPENLAQRERLWQLREDMPMSQPLEGASIKHDIAVPVHRIPEFIDKARAVIAQIAPQVRPCVFGHMGDGNLHFNIQQPAGEDPAAFLAQRDEISEAVYSLTASMQGSVAAEHGIGRLKRELLKATKSPIELNMMRAIKNAFDPANIINPGKLL